MLNRLRHIALILLVCPLWAQAGGEVTPSGARAAGLGNSSLVLSDLWSVANNQAGMVGLQGLRAGIYYHNMFLVDGLAEQGLIVAYGLENSAVALDYQNFGQGPFHEDRIGLSYAMRLTDKVDMGVQINYLSTRIDFQEYGRTSNLTVSLGLRAELSETFQLGVHIANPTQAMLSEFDDERLPTLLGLGVGYLVSPKVSLVSEVVKDIDAQAIVRGGVEYQIIEVLSLRAGLSTEPTLSSFGVGYSQDRFSADIAASYHQSLGYSSQISLQYTFGGDGE